MKKLPQVTVGAYVFDCTAEVVDDGIVFVTARSCADPKDAIGRKMNHMGPHDHPAEQFEIDVLRFAAKIAAELAGKMRSRDLAKAYVES